MVDLLKKITFRMNLTKVSQLADRPAQAMTDAVDSMRKLLEKKYKDEWIYRASYFEILKRPYVFGKAFIFNIFQPVGVTGFEPVTPCSQSRCANRTALHPDVHFENAGAKVSHFF